MASTILNLKPGRKIKDGSMIEITSLDGEKRVFAEAVGYGDDGTRMMRFSDESLLPDMGEIPLPPYIHVPLENPERYQTVYAKPEGSAAAPTAGLHFTPELLKELQQKGVQCAYTTLHIGLDTFRPVKEDDPSEHLIHREYGIIDAETADIINQAKREGRRVICVGTTSVRLVEAAAQAAGKDEVIPFEDWVDIFILPGFRFSIVDAMITNFHLPKSTLIMMVSAFAGAHNIKKVYQTAVEEKYRFYSFGDAMLMV